MSGVSRILVRCLIFAAGLFFKANAQNCLKGVSLAGQDVFLRDCTTVENDNVLATSGPGSGYLEIGMNVVARRGKIKNLSCTEFIVFEKDSREQRKRF